MSDPSTKPAGRDDQTSISDFVRSNRTGLKLGIAFGILIAILMGVVVLGLNRVSRMNAAMDEIMEKRWAKVQLSREALGYSGLNSRITMQVFLLEDRKQIEALLVQRAANTEKISALLREIEALVDSAEESALLTNVWERRVPYVECYKRALTMLLQEGRAEEARCMMRGPVLTNLIGYHQAWDRFVGFEGEQMNRTGSQAMADSQMSRMLFQSLGVVAVILATLIAIWTTRGLAQEIGMRQQLEGALRQAGSELEARVERRTRELARSLSLLNAAFESTTDGIVAFDLSGRMLYGNSRIYSMLGIPREVMERTSHTDIASLVAVQLTNPAQYLDLVRQSMVSHTQMAETFGLLNFKDGRIFERYLRLQRVGSEVVGRVVIYREITGRKRAETRLQASLEELRGKTALFEALVNSSPDGIMVVDPQGRRILQNRQMIDLWKIPPHLAVDETGDKQMAHIAGMFKDPSLFRQEIIYFYSHPEESARAEIELKDGTHLERHSSPVLDRGGKCYGRIWTYRDVTERRKAQESLLQLSGAIEQSADNVIITDKSGTIVYANPAALTSTGYSLEELLGETPRILKSGRHTDDFYQNLWKTLGSGRPFRAEFVNRKKNGEEYIEEKTITPVMDARGEITHYVATGRDMTERRQAEREREQMELQLRQAQKLEAVGQLAAGIAHEINTPTQYVGDNTRFLQDSFRGIQAVLKSHEQLLRAIRENALTPELTAQADELVSASDLDYLYDQIPAAIGETLEGVERVTRIVRAMKEFSHPGSREKSPADLNHAIETTTTVARNEWKYVADLKLELDPALPAVPCFIGEFNQVILNLVVNAAHAVGDVVKKHPGSKGIITIRTRRDRDCAEIRVSDTGTGIPEEARARIFEPFFTTKGVGKGTGQGLTIAYGNIVKKHGGTITFETETGKGTTFIIRMPLAARGGQSEPALPLAA